MVYNASCVSDGRPLGVSECLGNYTYGAFWGPITEYNECQDPDESNSTRELRTLAGVC